MILAPHIKSCRSPVERQINLLMERQGLPVLLKDGLRDLQLPSLLNGKIFATTFCGYKGIERDLVIVFGFHARDPVPEVRQMGMALSRCRQQLVVV